MNGQALKQALKEKGVKQKELASMTGLSEATISNIIRGKRGGDLETLKRVCKTLDIPPERIW